jgi:hypothetical protein
MLENLVNHNVRYLNFGRSIFQAQVPLKPVSNPQRSSHRGGCQPCQSPQDHNPRRSTGFLHASSHGPLRTFLRSGSTLQQRPGHPFHCAGHRPKATPTVSYHLTKGAPNSFTNATSKGATHCSLSKGAHLSPHQPTNCPALHSSHPVLCAYLHSSQKALSISTNSRSWHPQSRVCTR